MTINRTIRKHFSRIIMTMLLMLLTTSTAWAWEGSGTEASPYLITSYDDLLTLHDNVNGGTPYDNTYFKQTADIDWPANTTWTSGIGTDANHRFGGHYDGDGKAIRNYTCHQTSGEYAGLFGYVAGYYEHGSYKLTTLKNIVLEDCDIQTTGSYASGICAFIPVNSFIRVDNCRVSGTISGTSYASGIICNNSSSTYVTNSFADVTVNATKKGKIFAEIGPLTATTKLWATTTTTTATAWVSAIHTT